MPRRALAVPMSDPAVMPKTGLITDTWTDFFMELTKVIAAAPQRLIVSEALNLGASVGVTTPAVGLHGPGLYRITFYLRIVRPATVSSSVLVNLQWTDKGVNVTLPFPALTLNLTRGITTGTALARADSANSLGYSTTYSSVGAQNMQYDLISFYELVN